MSETTEATTKLTKHSISEIIFSHFDAYQRNDDEDSTTPTKRNARLSPSSIRAAAAIRDEIAQLSLEALTASLDGMSLHSKAKEHNNDNEIDAGSDSFDQTASEAATAIVRCLDSAMACIHCSIESGSGKGGTKNEGWNESVHCILELAAAFACSGRGFVGIGGSRKGLENGGIGNDGGIVARALIRRAMEYTLVERDVIRIESCKLLGWCIGLLMEGLDSGAAPASILKNKKLTKNNSKTVSGESKDNNGAVNVAEWKLECLIAAGNALVPRLTDKIAKVRSAAITACSSFFTPSSQRLFQATEPANKSSGMLDLEEVMETIAHTVTWLLCNDTSAPNRALATQCCPATRETIPCVMERVKDVDVKVREAALDCLREKVEMESLSEDQVAVILGMGLTKRCSSTHAKTIELLCCNWLKQCKFDPVALLQKLNPVINETVAESTARTILSVASYLDCQDTSSIADGKNMGLSKGLDLVHRSLSGPEIREFQKQVLKKRCITDNADATPKEEKESEETDDNMFSEEVDGLDPSTAIFLRVKCAFTVESKSLSPAAKTDTISDIIVDIPTLCQVLQARLEKLIAFNAKLNRGEISMDEDEANIIEDTYNFLCLQLIHMARSSEDSEVQEEGSRRHFISIMRSMLSRVETPDDLVDACVKAMAAAHDTEGQFLQTISEILVDVEEDDSFVVAGMEADEMSEDSKRSQKEAMARKVMKQMRIIAILSIVLENLSGQMVSNQILAGFYQHHLLPAITSKNAIVREYGVNCLSKFALLSEEDTVKEEVKPLLMKIAGSIEERVEVRAQAALAMCDLALIHGKDFMPSAQSDSDGEREDSPASFQDMLLEMLSHSNHGIVIIAAEIAAKLLLSGCFNDPELVAWLLVIYFDTSIMEREEDEESNENQVKEVGSPVRLQQLLSIFFPTYSMSSLDANDAIMASIPPLLSIINMKLAGKRSTKSLSQWPVAKMIEYVCYTVDLADKKKNDKPEEVGTTSEKVSDDDLMEPKEGGPSEADEKDAKDDKDDNSEVIEASSTLLASIDIAEFLSEESKIPVLYTRTLAKILGSACIDIDAEDKALLCRLKSQVTEAEYSISDRSALASLEKMSELLEEVRDETQLDSDEDKGDAAEDDLVQNMKNVAIEDAEDDIYAESEKENPRQSLASRVSMESAKLSVASETSRSSRRVHLADVN